MSVDALYLRELASTQKVSFLFERLALRFGFKLSKPDRDDSVCRRAARESKQYWPCGLQKPARCLLVADHNGTLSAFWHDLTNDGLLLG